MIKISIIMQLRFTMIHTWYFPLPFKNFFKCLYKGNKTIYKLNSIINDNYDTDFKIKMYILYIAKFNVSALKCTTSSV